MRDYILGLDLGTASIGWAIIDIETDDAGELVKETGIRAAGSRIFPEGVNRDSRGSEKPKNVERRTARGARRNRQRSHQRRHNLVRTLVDHGLLPPARKDREQLWKLDPYLLRTRGLDDALSPHEFGRAVFHLNQRRGFKSNRKSGEADTDKGMLKEINELSDAIVDSQARTLGEYLNGIAGPDRAPLVQGEERLRKRHTLRAMYEREFSLIWERQAKAHPGILTPSLRTKLADEILYFQRPLKPQSHLIGNCELEGDTQKRCPRSHWVAQQFRILCDVGNLMIQEPNGQERALSEHERAAVTDKLATTQKQTFDQIRKLLKIDPGCKFNLERGSRKNLGGNTAESRLATSIKKTRWNKLSDVVRTTLREAVTEAEQLDDVREAFGFLDLEPKALEDLLDYKGPPGYGNLSKLAMEKLIPHLETGLGLHEAKKAAGYLENSARVSALSQVLGAPPDIPNPVVRAALVEVRKVVNELIRTHGLPYRIVTELARDMKESAAAREERSKEMRERERERDAVREKLEDEFKIPSPSRKDIEKYRLWQDQETICPYSGRPIPIGRLFSSEIDVDHILPRWRSLDDSYLNKVVCYRHSNQEKGDRTPREWREGTGDFEEMIARVAGLKKMPFSKRRRFNQKEIEQDDFVARQLNDTRYISRAASDYLACLFEPEDRLSRVRVSRGQLTHELRHQWGLNSLLSPLPVTEGEDPVKYRGDHRHHAVDAIVVALSRPASLKRLANYWRQRDRKGQSAPRLEEPWENFRSTVGSVLDAIQVSRRPQAQLRGALHEATYYGPTSIAGEYAYRKPVASLTPAMLKKIRDPVIQAKIVERLAEHGWSEGGGEFPKGALDDAENPVQMNSGVPIKRVRITASISDPVEFKDKNTDKVFRVAPSGNNHHAEFLYPTEGDTERCAAVRVVSMREAAERARITRIPIVQRDHGELGQTRFALSIGDTVLIHDPKSETNHLCIVQKLSPTKSFVDIFFRDARDSRPPSESKPAFRITSQKAWNRFRIEKVRVSPCGQVFRSGI